jgi:hypothetical protein
MIIDATVSVLASVCDLCLPDLFAQVEKNRHQSLQCFYCEHNQCMALLTVSNGRIDHSLISGPISLDHTRSVARDAFAIVTPPRPKNEPLN